MNEEKTLYDFLEIKRQMDEFSYDEICFLARYFVNNQNNKIPPRLVNELNKRKVLHSAVMH